MSQGTNRSIEVNELFWLSFLVVSRSLEPILYSDLNTLLIVVDARVQLVAFSYT